MAVHFFDIMAYIMMYLGYPIFDKGAFDNFETSEEFNPLNKSETIRLHGNYHNFVYKHCSTGGTNETCYDIIQDYPPAITIFRIGVWCHWELVLVYIIPFGIVVACCETKKYTKYLVPFVVLFCESVNAVGFVIYAQVIGPSVGFKWNDLTYFYYFGVISPTKLIIAILFIYKGFKFLKKSMKNCGLIKKPIQYEGFTNETEVSSDWM
ncbi:uncharacterized protein LOC123554055 [Mercenaria mercenaria]|uniref:uncharacterized protein LOC123554055 n=1 Tax=Mercenaria mercenaria TaxID=6596 RepID=UPI00234EABEA|nr:uncharacterized protein LOC123554055 [Mercenaria mercenaria]